LAGSIGIDLKLYGFDGTGFENKKEYCICLSIFRDNEMVKVLTECQHVYHSECLICGLVLILVALSVELRSTHVSNKFSKEINILLPPFQNECHFSQKNCFKMNVTLHFQYNFNFLLPTLPSINTPNFSLTIFYTTLSLSFSYKVRVI